jgi:hypothetical protein
MSEAAPSARRALSPPVIVTLAALFVRLPLLLTPGYDVHDYRIWTRIVAQVGIGAAYAADYPTAWYNYPPFYLYVLRLTAAVYAPLRPAEFWDEQLLIFLLKLSPILAELALGALLYRVLLRHGPPTLALGALAAYLLNPAIIWNTAYWGGIDAFHALFLTAALVAAAERRPQWAWPLATLAIGAKLLALPGALATIPTQLRQPQRGRLALAALAALIIGLLLAAPIIARGQFGVLLRAMFRNVGNMPAVSLNAHNLWWLVTLGNGDRPDTTFALWNLSYRSLGLLLFGLCAALICARLWRHGGDIVAICGAGALLTFAFFLVTTEVHENWAFAQFAPLAIAAALRPRFRPLYAVLSLTALVNFALHDPPLRTLIGAAFDGTAHLLGVLNAAVNCAAFVWWAWLLLRESKQVGSDNATLPTTSEARGPARHRSSPLR